MMLSLDSDVATTNRLRIGSEGETRNDQERGPREQQRQQHRSVYLLCRRLQKLRDQLVAFDDAIIEHDRAVREVIATRWSAAVEKLVANDGRERQARNREVVGLLQSLAALAPIHAPRVPEDCKSHDSSSVAENPRYQGDRSDDEASGAYAEDYFGEQQEMVTPLFAYDRNARPVRSNLRRFQAAERARADVGDKATKLGGGREHISSPRVTFPLFDDATTRADGEESYDDSPLADQAKEHGSWSQESRRGSDRESLMRKNLPPPRKVKETPKVKESTVPSRRDAQLRKGNSTARIAPIPHPPMDFVRSGADGCMKRFRSTSTLLKSQTVPRRVSFATAEDSDIDNNDKDVASSGTSSTDSLSSSTSSDLSSPSSSSSSSLSRSRKRSNRSRRSHSPDGSDRSRRPTRHRHNDGATGSKLRAAMRSAPPPLKRPRQPDKAELDRQERGGRRLDPSGRDKKPVSVTKEEETLGWGAPMGAYKKNKAKQKVKLAPLILPFLPDPSVVVAMEEQSTSGGGGRGDEVPHDAKPSAAAAAED